MLKKKLLGLATCVLSQLSPYSAVQADDRLCHLAECEKKECLEIIQEADLPTLWNHFLTAQVHLFFKHEANFLQTQKSWLTARHVLEIGSGNGFYLAQFAQSFPEKSFVGIEVDPLLLEEANKQDSLSNLSFYSGDAENELADYEQQFDAVIFRLVLQHLNKPRLALQYAHRYLNEKGHVIIVDAYDKIREGSHRINSIEQATDSLISKRYQKEDFKCDRLITLEILKELEQKDSEMSKLYKVAYSNINTEGQRIANDILFTVEKDGSHIFNQVMLFLAVVEREFNIPLNLADGYDELQVYLKDSTAWLRPGVHFLILEKK